MMDGKEESRRYPSGYSFRVFGGYCKVEGGALIIKQSIFRHLHQFTWLFSIVFILLGIYSYLTGWIYTRGPPLDWKLFLIFGLYAPGLKILRILLDRIKGFTWDGEIPLNSIVDVNVEEEKMRWYLKERKIIPAFIIRYEKNGLKKRRIRLNVRYHEEEFKEGKKFFERLGFKVNS